MVESKTNPVCGRMVRSDPNQNTWLSGQDCLSYLLFYCCEEIPWPKLTYKGRYLIGGLLTISEGKSMNMVGNTEAGKVAESSHLF